MDRVSSDEPSLRTAARGMRVAHGSASNMQNWVYAGVAGAALLAIPLAWMVLRYRAMSFDVEPVSRNWLEEQKRAREEG